jgi:formylglycine-generating enzyme
MRTIIKMPVCLLLLASILVLACGSTSPGPADASTPDSAVPGKPCLSAHGPPMVRVPSPTSPTGSFCMDATEVTRKHYQEFVSRAGDPANLAKADVCKLVNVAPQAECLQEASVCRGSCDDHPQVCVEWCSAFAYCKWAGKRLCGGFDGKAIKRAPNEVRDNEWFLACGGGLRSDGTLERRYTYGDNFSEVACNTTSSAVPCPKGGCTTLPVGSLKTCQGNGDFAGIFDLNGNVSEWVDQRDAQTPTSVFALGASFSLRLEPGAGVGCGEAVTQASGLAIANADIGFRCCAD